MPKFLNVLNMNGNEIQNFAVHTVAAGSAQTVAGTIILDGTALKYYDGSNYLTLGTGTGDITGVTLAGDSGSASDNSGNADLNIFGGTGITTSATGTTVTIDGDNATTTAKGIASFSSDNFAVSSGAVTIKDGGVALAEMANFAANSIMGNNTGSAATPLALSAGQTKTLLSLNNVENTAISTFAGSSNITTLGTISSGTWQGTAIASAYLDSDTMHLSVAQTITGEKTISTDDKFYFRDSDIYLQSAADGHLDVVADTEIHLSSPSLNMDGAMDISGDLTLSGEDGALTFDAASSIKIVDNNAAALVIEEANTAYMTFDTRDNSEAVTIHKNLTLSGNLTVSGTTTTVNSTTVSIADPIFELGASGSDDNLDRGIKMKYNDGSAKIAFMGYDDSTGKFTMIPDATDTSSVFSGTAGTLVMTTFEGALTGNVTGDVSGSAATVTGAAQTNITSLGTLTALNVDNITIDGNTISSTDTNGDITLTPNGTGEVNIAAGNLNYASTAVTSTGAELNLVDGSSAGSVVNSKAVIYGSSGEVNATTLQIGGTSITSTATELNIMDGDTSATSTTIADADRVVVNDNGTMKQVAVTDMSTYYQSKETTANKITKKISGDGSDVDFTVTHNFGTPIVTVQVLDYGDNGSGATYDVVHPDIKRQSDNAVEIVFGSAPSSTQDYLVLITKMPAIS